MITALCVWLLLILLMFGPVATVHFVAWLAWRRDTNQAIRIANSGTAKPVPTVKRI